MAKRSNNRKAQGSGTIRQRKDGTWEGRYTPGRDTGTGKQIQKSVYGKTQEEVRKKLTAIQSEIDLGIYIDPVRLTVGQWADIWLAEYIGAVKATTKEQYLYQVTEHIKPALGAVKLSALTAPMVQKMYNDAMKEHKAKRKSKDGKMVTKVVPGISAKSVKNLHGVFHRMMAQAVLLGYIGSNPCDVCKLPRCEKKEIQPLSEGLLKDFLQAIKGDPYEDIYFVDVFTGMRQGEILGLCWDCVDFRKGTITVKQQLQQIRKRGCAGTYQLVPTKNDKARVIQPAPDVMNVLRKIQTKQKELILASGKAWQNEWNLVFVNEMGGHLVDETVYNHLKKIVREMGIPETRFHDLRHTYATTALQIGDPVKTVSENLGHATVAFTLDIYGHVTDQMKKDSADRMQRLINAL